MPIEATFSLTPMESYHYISNGNQAQLAHAQGAMFYRKDANKRFSFYGQSSTDELFFERYNAADPAVDYSVWDNRRKVPRIFLYYKLIDLGVMKELALVFGFDVISESARLLIYTDAGLLSDKTLIQGDSQFLLEAESLDSIHLYFIHACLENSYYGGNWFFKGITGYVV